MNDEYPTDGQAVGIYDTEPDERHEREAQAEQGALEASVPVIEEVIAWFEEQLDAVDSTKNIDLGIVDKVSAEQQILAYQKLAELLENQRSAFLSRFNTYIQQRKEQDES